MEKLSIRLELDNSAAPLQLSSVSRRRTYALKNPCMCFPARIGIIPRPTINEIHNKTRGVSQSFALPSPLQISGSTMLSNATYRDREDRQNFSTL